VFITSRVRVETEGDAWQINLLGLEKELLTVAKSEPAAQTRFLHISGSSSGLSPLPSPSSILSLLTSPLSGQIYNGLQRDFWTAYNRPDVEDESVDAFFTRRFGPEFARIFASALVHGIYAMDSRKLSLRAAFPMLWNAEDYGGGSVLWGTLKPKPKGPVDDSVPYDLGSSLPELMKDVAVYSFKDGLSTLSNALVAALKSRSNVEIRTGDPVSSVNLNGPFKVCCCIASLELGLIDSRHFTDHNRVRVGRITNTHHLRSARQAVERCVTRCQHRT